MLQRSSVLVERKDMLPPYLPPPTLLMLSQPRLCAGPRAALLQSDTEVYYDLKKLLEESKSMVPPELARHEASKNKPGSMEGKKRDAIQYAKK